MKHVAVDEEITAASSVTVNPDVQAGLACPAIGLRLAYESGRSLFDRMAASPNSLANRHSDALCALGGVGAVRDIYPLREQAPRHAASHTHVHHLFSPVAMRKAAQTGAAGTTLNGLACKRFR